MRSNRLLALILILPSASPAFGQSRDSTTPPLGDIARKNGTVKKEKSDPKKAKHVFTDDDLSVRKSPIPAIALQGADNTENILAAIHEFQAKHDAAATENAVHEWFDQETEILSAAIDSNARLSKHNQMRMEAAQDRSSYPYSYGYDGDYSKYNERMTTERWSQRVDARSSQENFQVISRIQQALARVRNDVIFNRCRTKTAYDWFKIRSANGTY